MMHISYIFDTSFPKIKGAVCSFGKDILIRRERSSLTDFFLYLNKLDKPTPFIFMTE